MVVRARKQRGGERFPRSGRLPRAIPKVTFRIADPRPASRRRSLSPSAAVTAKTDAGFLLLFFGAMTLNKLMTDQRYGSTISTRPAFTCGTSQLCRSSPCDTSCLAMNALRRHVSEAARLKVYAQPDKAGPWPCSSAPTRACYRCSVAWPLAVPAPCSTAPTTRTCCNSVLAAERAGLTKTVLLFHKLAGSHYSLPHASSLSALTISVPGPQCPSLKTPCIGVYVCVRVHRSYGPPRSF